MADSWYVEHARTEEVIVSGKRLGRQVRHDSRNLRYAWQRQDRALTSQMWSRHIPILGQGSVGDCTANAEVGALGTDPCFGALPASPPLLDQNLCLKMYAAEVNLDGDGPFPPNDPGSSGPTAAKIAQQFGLISGYVHCFGLADVLDALEDHPVCLGTNWYEGMDSPDSMGVVTISGGIRGGHEYLCRGKDTERKLVFLDNSWGPDWGVAGSFAYTWDTLERLLGEQGDGTVSIPLTAPAPEPQPVPVPTPAPSPGPADADLELFRGTFTWAEERHHVGTAKTVAGDLRHWYAAKGFR